MSEVSQHPAAIVTGAGRGIGRAVAIALAREGFSLCLVARTREQLEETRRLTGHPPRRALIVLADLADEESPEAVFAAAEQCFGRIDVLVNNAGWAPPRTSLIKFSAADQDRVLALNLRAPIALCRIVARGMVQNGAGAIINIASAAAWHAATGEAIYAAAKAGLIAFTRAAFAELRERGVKVSVVVPGLVDTVLIPHNKRFDRALMLSAQDVAAAVVQIIGSPTRACPVEIVLEPQRNPQRADRCA